MSNIQTGAERMPHDLYHLCFLAGQIGRLINISTTPFIAGDSFEMDAVGALRLSPLRRGLAIDSTVSICTFSVTHRHVYGEQWIKFMKDGVNATPLPSVNTTGYIDYVFFFQAEDGIRDKLVTGVQTCALPIWRDRWRRRRSRRPGTALRPRRPPRCRIAPRGSRPRSNPPARPRPCRRRECSPSTTRRSGRPGAT